MPADSITIPVSRNVDLRCASQHFGAWAIEPKWFKTAMDAVRAGTLKPAKKAKAKKDKAKTDYDDDDDAGGARYEVRNGVAIICIDGQMTKRGSSFGGCSTVQVRQDLRAAAADWMVKAILLHICSPGGTCAGTADLAGDVLEARKAKPVYAYAADMCCSAAYWVASQCQVIYANVTAIVGSIGTYCLLEDDTGMQEQYGVKLRVVSTGEYKGLGADGVVSDKLVADVQREVNELNVPFIAAVASGRGKKIPDVATVADGRAHVGVQAKTLGLIDEVSTLDASMAAIQKEIGTMPITSEQFSEHAAKNPGAAEVQALINQGLNKPATAAELAAAFPDESAFAMSQLTTGASLNAALTAGCKHMGTKLASAKTDHAQALSAKDAAHSTAIAEKDKLIAQLKHEASGQAAVNTGAGAKAAAQENVTKTDADLEKIKDPKARAKAEWAANFNACQEAYINEAVYIGARSAELRGGVTMVKPGA